MIMYIQVLAGFVLLVGAAEILVRGAVSLADRFGISPLVIGMEVHMLCAGAYISSTLYAAGTPIGPAVMFG